MKAEPRHETAVLALSNDPGLWDTIMLKYGFLNQWAAKEVFPLAIEHGVGILNMAAVRLSLSRPQRSREVVARWKEEGLIAPDDLPDDGPFDWLYGRRRGLGNLRRIQVRRGPPGGFDGNHGYVEHRASRGQRKVARKTCAAEPIHHERLVRLFEDSAEPD